MRATPVRGDAFRGGERGAKRAAQRDARRVSITARRRASGTTRQAVVERVNQGNAGCFAPTRRVRYGPRRPRKAGTNAQRPYAVPAFRHGPRTPRLVPARTAFLVRRRDYAIISVTKHFGNHAP
jgi:hypothetical protein